MGCNCGRTSGRAPMTPDPTIAYQIKHVDQTVTKASTLREARQLATQPGDKIQAVRT